MPLRRLLALGQSYQEVAEPRRDKPLEQCEIPARHVCSRAKRSRTGWTAQRDGGKEVLSVFYRTDGGGDFFNRIRIEQHGGVTGYLGQACCIAAEHWLPGCHCLEDRHSKTLVQRRINQCRACPDQRRELHIGHVPGEDEASGRIGLSMRCQLAHGVGGCACTDNLQVRVEMSLTELAVRFDQRAVIFVRPEVRRVDEESPVAHT